MGFSRALCLRHRHTPILVSPLLFLTESFVLLVRFVRTLGVVAWPCLSIPQTPFILLTPCVLHLVSAA